MMSEIKKQIQQALETYGKFAKVYADYTFTKLPQFHLNKFISLLKGKRILDAGCGAGRDVQYFMDEGFTAIGIDNSLKLLSEAKSRVKGSFMHMDFRNLEFDRNNFDGIWCVASLSDVDDDDCKKTLKEFCNVLKNEGVLFASVREGHGQEIINNPRYENNPRYYNKYTKEKIEGFLKDSGFTVISCSQFKDENKSWIEVFARKK